MFTDLVGFSSWSLQAGDDATLKLLRRVAAAIEPPMLDRGGHIVKRMGDGLMAVFHTPEIALTSVLAAYDAVKDVEVDGYAPRMRFGIHTGRPQRIGADWLGVDVNIAARVMERAPGAGSWCPGPRWTSCRRAASRSWASPPSGCVDRCSPAGPNGVPTDLTMYRLKIRRDLTAEDGADDD